MKICRVVPLAAALLLAGAAAPPAGAAKRSPCFAAKGKTIAVNTQARVLTRRSGGVLLGCTRNQRPRRLARNFDDGYVSSGAFGAVELAGFYVAYAYTTTDMSCKAACPDDYEATKASLTVANLVTRRSASTSAWSGRPFVVTATGASAWISGAGNDPRSVDAFFQGVVSRQDTGAIQDDSLEASHSRITWLKDGQVRGAFFG
jgi:hypothetical protein